MPRWRTAEEDRAKAIAMHRGGRSCADIARALKRNRTTIRTWTDPDYHEKRMAQINIARAEREKAKLEPKKHKPSMPRVPM